MENKRIGLKVTGIIVAIIVGVTLLAVIFRFTLLPVWKYNVAISNASKGDYALATRGMYELDYKDSEALGQEYALAAGKKLVEDGKVDEAKMYLTVAITTGENEEFRAEAVKLFESIQ